MVGCTVLLRFTLYHSVVLELLLLVASVLEDQDGNRIIRAVVVLATFEAMAKTDPHGVNWELCLKMPMNSNTSAPDEYYCNSIQMKRALVTSSSTPLTAPVTSSASPSTAKPPAVGLVVELHQSNVAILNTTCFGI